MVDDLNSGFTKRELKLLAVVGYSASLSEQSDGWHVYLYDAEAPKSDVVALGIAKIRLDALRDAIAQAQSLPRCACGGARSVRWHACVRCGEPLLTRGKEVYEAWIADWVSKQRYIRGTCARAASDMVAAFPELKRVAGWVYGPKTPSTEHFWCVVPDGSIVDPSASQFSGALNYRPFQPGDEVCVGRCMNCGDYIYARVDKLEGGVRRSVCSDACSRALESQLSFEAFQARHG